MKFDFEGELKVPVVLLKKSVSSCRLSFMFFGANLMNFCNEIDLSVSQYMVIKLVAGYQARAVLWIRWSKWLVRWGFGAGLR